MVHSGMIKPQKIKLRCYADHMVDLNEYLSALTGTKANEKIGETELNKIFFINMNDGWINKACVQGFACEKITFKNV